MNEKAEVSVRSFFVFSDLIEAAEGNEDEKLLYYYPEEIDLHTKVRHLGLTEALIKFTKSFQPQYKYESLYTKKSRQIFFEAEPNYWIILMVDLAKRVPKKLTSNEDEEEVVEYCNDNVNDNILHAIIEQLYSFYRFFNGTFHSNFKQFQVDGLRRSCREFFTKHISSINVSNVDITAVLNGVYYHPLDNLSFLNIQCFNNMLQMEHPFIKHMSFFYKESLIWNGIENDDMKVLYCYLVDNLFQSMEAQILKAGEKASKASLSSNIPGQFLSFSDEGADYRNPSRFIKTVHLRHNNENRIYNLLIFRKFDTTTCLFVEEEKQFTDAQLKSLEDNLDVKMALLINNTIAINLPPKNVQLSRDLLNRSTDNAISHDINYLYFNHVNLAINTSIFSDKKLNQNELKIPKAVLNEIEALNLNHFRTESIDDQYFKEIVLQLSGCDYWIIYNISMLRELFIVLKRKDITFVEIIERQFASVERQRYDGWFNNLAFHDWGSIGSHLNRICPAAYSDGVYMLAGQGRPSARSLSQMFMNGTDGLASLRNRTTMLAFFGQVVTSEIVMSSEGGCPIERHHIDIDRCDSTYDNECKGDRYIPFHRATYDRRTGRNPNSPREQINQVTSWIDGSFIYSTSEAWMNSMRSFQNGTLLTDSTGNMPIRNKIRAPLFNSVVPHMMQMLSPERFYLLGDPRSNQNPALLVFSILFFRWHNTVAQRVQSQFPNWSDEEVFQKARRIVIASLQNIIAYEYFPMFVGFELPKYEGYKAFIHPGISQEFQASAFRFGHSLIPPGMYKRDGQCNFEKTKNGYAAYRLCSTWWDPNAVFEESSIEELLMGMTSQIAEREDAILCSDIRNKLFGPMEFSRRDLGALNIMRGRDNGLPDYNTVRTYFKLDKVKNWNDINPRLFDKDPDLLKLLISAYSDKLDDVDLYVGGMLESYGEPGELFAEIIKEQFIRLRDGDRFWFENFDNQIFTKDEIDEIRQITLWDVIVNSTDILPHEIQKNVFTWADNDPCPQPFQLNVSVLAPCQYLKNYDYQHGNELMYLYSCTLILFIPILCILVGYGVIKVENRRRRRLKLKQEKLLKKHEVTAIQKPIEKVIVREWLHANHKRFIKLKLGPDAALHVINRKDDTLRTLNLSHVDNVIVEESKELKNFKKRPILIIRVPKDYDLVLEWDSLSSRKKFVIKLETFLNSLNKGLIRLQNIREMMLMKAETFERRQNRLEHFFREAYALTFGLKANERRKISTRFDDEIVTVMKTSLSKIEFANALGMKQDAIFVKKMFNIVDKDCDGRISFQEFLDTVVLFSHGKPEDKLRIIFDMCDNDKNGVIDKNELSDMLRSLIEVARTNSLLDEHITELIDRMFQDNGLAHKNYLTYNDFKVMMNDYKGDFVAIGLDCKGVKQNFLDTSTNLVRIPSFPLDQPIFDADRHFIITKWSYLTTFLEENRQNIFYLFLFYIVTIALFVERFIHYSFMSEHTDLRHIMGVGIAITRGSAASLSFCYSLLLLTMSRNLITKLKEFSIQQYIPFDSHIQFHKIAACTALFFSILHTFGHLVNFYHVSTQSVDNLKCLTNEINFPSDYKPGLAFWLFQTLTGITGVLLFIVMCVIFIFAHPLIRKRAYNLFWATHGLYIVLYALCLIHGLAKLTGEPRFWMFILIPGVIFALDKVISLRTRFMMLDIIETELLPSDVIKIRFYRPPNFKYLSGQWVRLTCTTFKKQDFHSFTLTSAPHENFLSCHIKAQGPWTWKLRNYFDPSNLNPEDRPKIMLEGPYGGGNQDWYKFEVAVMVGGGIGVTPYASILNDLVFGTSTNRYSGVACKKVYFLWICPSHKHFEWFIDVLRDVERKDVTNVLEVHIFITQFFHKFDLRTTMLYICENHFQRLSKTSLFTGLKAVNHFGRPDMSSFLKFVQKKHSYVSKIGVFSCGPRPLTKSVMSACEEVNVSRKLPYFIHHFENFG